MKSPNERIADLESEVQLLKGEVEAVLSSTFGAVHMTLQGLLEAKKITYIEKRLIWERIGGEITVCLAASHRLNNMLDYRLDKMDRLNRS